MLQNQLANYGDKMFDKDTATIVRKHSFFGALVMALPLFGLDWIVYIGVLWHMYSSLCERANTTLHLGNVITGFLVNVVVAIAIDLVLSFFPVVGWLGTGFLVYLQFYSSGKSFWETIKKTNR